MADRPRDFRWYCVQTKPKNEKRALFHLERWGIETLNPQIETYVSRSGIPHKVLEPLFPGYFFARLHLASHFPTVRWARGVRRILGNEDGPTPVSEGIIEEIRRRVDNRGVARRPYDLKPDDPVRIKSGPLKDLIGIFERWSPREERIRVLLHLLGQETRVDLEYAQVEKLWLHTKQEDLSVR